MTEGRGVRLCKVHQKSKEPEDPQLRITIYPLAVSLLHWSLEGLQATMSHHGPHSTGFRKVGYVKDLSADPLRGRERWIFVGLVHNLKDTTQCDRKPELILTYHDTWPLIVTPGMSAARVLVSSTIKHHCGLCKRRLDSLECK